MEVQDEPNKKIKETPEENHRGNKVGAQTPVDHTKEPNPHPLETQNFLLQLILFWVKDVTKKCSRLTWTQEMNYDLPEYDKSTTKKQMLFEAITSKSGFIWGVLSCYKLQTFIISVVQILRIGAENLSIILESAAFSNLSKLPIYQNEANLLKAGGLLIAGSISKLVSNQVAYYIQFYAYRVSICVRSSMYSILYDKILDYSILNSSSITPGFITDLVEVDLTQLEGFFDQVDNIMFIVMGLPSNLALVYYYYGWREILIMFGLLVVLESAKLLKCQLDAFIRRRYLAAKDRRMGLLRNVLEATDFVKINGLENFFCLEMWRKREDEIFWLKVKAVVTSLDAITLQLSTRTLIYLIFWWYWVASGATDINLMDYF